jgi:hypothetical protein
VIPYKFDFGFDGIALELVVVLALRSFGHPMRMALRMTTLME